ncbi:putative rta1 domain protein [Neofusicoccum parvum UCRNP2]|uniref:Putative rta1 domain protein n=1 Tax=Botryosphaeria parva (strain UCR-NP2) TaxID=1287680 RepID=R1EJC1_BOTPV|nr:putative rta1 domain protein [Neofusicoccum parvum UCRNP2]
MSSPLLTKQCDKVTPECPVSGTIYGFYPSVGWNAFACAIFATCTIAQLIIGIRKRTWSYLLAVSLGSAPSPAPPTQLTPHSCLLESTGSIGMLLLSANPYSTRGFQLEIVCLTTAPAFLAAGIYLTLKHLVLAFGPHLSLIRPPALYTWLFVACDVVSIALQAGGSALAARQDVATIETAVNLIVAGMAFQVATLGIFFKNSIAMDTW